ncbi:F12F1.11-RELATED [Salix koriyanagi]|uniref:F12F1.11-RELATED n=1 Tax=Salix koriyanagi TaxID=2511006 RepID=A0A9Q0Q9A2_9ROSI|nr:F12F1.11-RELATED [Salix koriyanagi]
MISAAYPFSSLVFKSNQNNTNPTLSLSTASLQISAEYIYIYIYHFCQPVTPPNKSNQIPKETKKRKMKIKNKGKVYPSPSSSSSSSSVGDNGDRDVLSVFKLLPAAILALASVLSLEDREVLAYMITRSLKTTTTTTNNPSSSLQDSKKKSSKKTQNNNNSQNSNHIAPVFDCDCFDCYRSYWFRWDSSPNRELIHQVIEAFEEHLASGEMSRKHTRGKRRDKAGRRAGEKSVLDNPGQTRNVTGSGDQ